MKNMISNIKTLYILLMAAATMTFSACSSSDDISEQSANPAKPQVYTMTIQATKSNAGSTRALSLDGQTLNVSWNKKVVVKIAQLHQYNKPVYGDVAITLATATHVIYAAVSSKEAFNIKLTAETSVYTYTYNKDNVTFTPGKYYEVKVKMKRQPKTFNLSEVGGDITLMDGDVVTGSLTGESQKYKVSIADGATVTLSGADIYGMDYEDCKWAGITCEGDAIIVLKDNTLNAVQGFYKDYPGIFVPQRL